MRPTRRETLGTLSAIVILAASGLTASDRDGQAQEAGKPPAVPRVWDDGQLESLELPPADPAHSPTLPSADYYYAIPVRKLHKLYPVYRADRQKPGYIEWLKGQTPEEITFDPNTPEDDPRWIEYGEKVFDSPIFFFPYDESLVDPEVYEKRAELAGKDGVNPFVHWVVREPGKVEMGAGGCVDCHVRVMADGSLVKGAQGNRPVDATFFRFLRSQYAEAKDKEEFLEGVRRDERQEFGTPWLKSDPHARLAEMSFEEIAGWHESYPKGVMTREDGSLFFPIQVPDLIGIEGRRYFDKTGLVQHRGPADLMRYAALVQGANRLKSFGGWMPYGVDEKRLPPPETQSRYSDVQLYALARYIYALKPPANPNVPTNTAGRELVRRGEEVFKGEDCSRCHTPPSYTNNELMPVAGFEVPDSHRRDPRFRIIGEPIETDPGLALKTRRGTGYYKVPSLRGLWYRGPFGHDGSCATLEDWFDPRRLEADYVPTGFRGYKVDRRSVPGHEYGVDLDEGDREALIAFLKTL